jgi:hypothetical protein
MARGIILGMATNPDGSPVANGTANLSSIHGLVTVNGTRVKLDSKPRDFKAGLFAVPFFWDHIDADNFARVVSNDLFNVKMSVFRKEKAGGIATFFSGIATTDGLQFLATLKMGKVSLTGTPKDGAKILIPMLKDAIKGDEFKGIPFTNFSTEQTAIMGAVIARFKE